MWPNFDGKPYTRDALAAHINACDFSKWRHKSGVIARPLFLTLHNTSTPDLKLYLSWSKEKRQQYIHNMQPYYQGMGWHGGPHFFVPPDDDIVAFGFNNLMAAGTHASCFNDGSIGIEMFGEFDREPFDSGPGAAVRDHAVYLMALLHNRIGITPVPYAYGRSGLHFHVECRHDNHDCPGSFVHKADVIARVQAQMAALKAPPQTVAAPPAAPTPVPATPVATPTPASAPAGLLARVTALAAASDLAKVNWRNRGQAPIGYTKGMAAAFAVVYAKLKASDPAARLMAIANSGDDNTDAISWYNSNFALIGMHNDAAGPDVLRHLFVLLTGLGMRESSGRYCEGKSSDPMTGDPSDQTAAGAFQMSWNAHVASEHIGHLFKHYQTDDQSDGLLSIFREGVAPSDKDLRNYGTGDGAWFQALCKAKPAFAVEAAAVGLRTDRKHWGPINRKDAEIRPEADRLFAAVQAEVDKA